jgi:hypothetical protein
MASDEEQIRKLMESEIRVKGLSTSLDTLRRSLMGQVEAAQRAGATQAQLNAIWSQSLPKINATSKALDTAMADLDKSSKKAGQGMLFASYAIQDFQAAGMRGALNNIPQLVAAFGGGAGLAGAVQIAAVAIQALTPAFEKLMEAMSSERVDRWASALEKAGKRIEELKKEDILSAIEGFELRVLEGQQASAQKGKAAWEHQPKYTPGQRAAGGAGLEALTDSPQWEAAREKMRQALFGQLADQAAANAEAEIRKIEGERSGLGTAWQDVKGMFTGATPAKGGTEARIKKAIENARETARTNANDTTDTELGKLLDDAKTGDPEALKKLAARLRASGFAELAGQLEDEAALAKLKAEPVGPPDLMKEVRDSQERTDAEEQAIADAADERRRERDAADWERRKGEAQKRIGEVDRTRPDWNADTDEQALMRSVAMGKTETQKTGYVPNAWRAEINARLPRSLRWKADAMGNSYRTVRRAVSLEEASKQLEEERYEALTAKGVEPAFARRDAKAYGERAYGAQMQTGYNAMKQLQEMGMTGQIGRGVQMMGGEAYIDSVQTAREGVDKQMLEYQKLMAEAAVATREWQRVNGVAARVGRRKGP